MSYNSQDQAQRETLQTEIQTDPKSYGYAPLVSQGSDQGVADLLNEVRTGITTVRQGIRSGREVMSAIDAQAFAGLAAGPRDYLIALVSPGEVDLSNDVVRLSLRNLFPTSVANDPTRARLQAMADKPSASRAEELFGLDTTITARDVAEAIRPQAVMAMVEAEHSRTAELAAETRKARRTT